MTDRSNENIDFLNTLGREFCSALDNVIDADEISPHDCYSVIAPFLARPVTPEALGALTNDELLDLAAAFNKFFESDLVRIAPMQSAITNTLQRWSQEDNE